MDLQKIQQDIFVVGQKKDNNDGNISEDCDLPEDYRTGATLYQSSDNCNTDCDNNGGEDDHYNYDHNNE